MAKYAVTPTGRERRFGENEIIVSKTDLKGRIIYANDVFLKIADFTEKEALNQPHSIVRHPDMPRSVFKLLWDTLEQKREIFAYVKNMAKNGDHYWVFAHVTPSLNEAGEIIGYHSNRRAPYASALEKVEPLYAQLLETESAPQNARQGLAAGEALLKRTIEDTGMSYEEFVFTL